MIEGEEGLGTELNYVVLPLYSSNSGGKYVAERSGLNQWLAAGRTRRFGECYFPVPRDVHRVAKGFFPPRGQLFKLLLPGDLTSRAKLCQSDDKALMTSPNHHLGMWIYKLIDPEPTAFVDRMNRRSAYVFADLEALGFDCVQVSKSGDTYALTPLDLGGYERWIRIGLSELSRD